MKHNVTNETLHAKIRSYIGSHPFVSNVIAAGIVNYSALARRIQKEIGGNVGTIKVALARESKNTVRFMGYDDAKVTEFLRNSRISVQGKTAVVVSEKKLDIPRLIANEITSNNVYIVDQTKLGINKAKNVKVYKDLVAVIINSPERIERTPGVVAFISQFFASKGVSIREFVSCYTDTVIVLDQKDGAKAFSLFQEFLK